MRPLVIVDGENARRSRWPNLAPAQLVELSREWARDQGVDLLVVFDGEAPEDAPDVVGSGRESADDWIVRRVHRARDYWLVTSDRELRERAGSRAARVIGGGAFLRELEL